MTALQSCTALAAALLLCACGSHGSDDVKTTTPTSTLGTDSAAAKVGGTPPADTTGR